MSPSSIIGAKFGRLTLLREVPAIRGGDGKAVRLAEVSCECGACVTVRLKNLKSGNTTSCGCMKRAALVSHNAEASTPQTWIVDGEMAYIEIRGQRVLVNASDVPLVSQYRWNISPLGYVSSMNRGDRVSMHRLIMGLGHGDPREVDHRDRKPWDNRRSELRIATSSQNKMNRGSRVGATSRFKGVSWDADRKKWLAQGNHRFLGRFDREEDAAAAYDREAAKAFGEFAFLNKHNDGGQHASNCN